MAVEAYKTRIKRGGTPTSFSSEPMSPLSTDYVEYQIDDDTKQVWSRESSDTPSISEDGAPVGSSEYSLDYLFGKVEFDTARSSSVTITVDGGKYIPVGSSERITHCNDHTLTQEVNVLEDGGFKEYQDNGGNRTRIMGLKDSNVSLSRFVDAENDFWEDLNDGTSVLVEIEPGNLGYIFRGWYKLENDNLSGGVEDLESGDVSLQLDAKRKDEGEVISMGWNK